MVVDLGELYSRIRRGSPGAPAILVGLLIRLYRKRKSSLKP